MVERRLLDQQPRDARLQMRKGSPLGLTLEELDDRGLLEGGGVVPSYYTSLKQKNRRQLELQDRSSRMRQRGQEDTLKLKNSSNIIRMIRVLVQKGLNLEEYFRLSDSEGSDGGMIEKDAFVNILRKFDLPFTVKDLFLFSQRYAISSLQIDYELFFNDIQHGMDGDDSLGSNPILHLTNQQLGPASTSSQQPFHLINDLKKMLLQSKTILQKSYDEIYRMFSRWDNYGIGMVTITQFFRVLDQLHIQFHDYEQDFLVDLLDSDGQGKVDFEGLLAYCFASDDEMNRIPTHVNTVTNANPPINTNGGIIGMVDGTDESITGSIVTGGGTISTDKKSISLKRPHTASAFRGTEENTNYDSYQSNSNNRGDTSNPSDTTLPLLINTNQTNSRRPLTASGRVLNGEYKAKPKNNNDPFEKSSIMNSSSRAHSRPQSASASRPLLDENHHGYILDIQSDNEGEEDGFPSHTHKPFDMGIIQPPPPNDGRLGNYHQPTNNYNTLSQSLVISPISQDKSYRTPSSLASLGQSSVEITSNSIHSIPPGSQAQFTSDIRQATFQSNNTLSQPLANSPTNPLQFTTAKSNLRSVMSIYLRQKNCTVADIFALFDQKNVRFFGVKELVETSQHYFHLNLSPSIASALVAAIAVGGYDRLSYSDLLVFLTDPLYQELEEKLQVQIAEQLEHQGREYQYLLFSILSQESSATSSIPSGLSHSQSSGIISSESFRQSLTKLGFSLNPSDIDRIITKYDTHGTGKCSISRFMTMIQNNFYWKFTLNTLAYSEEAVEECQIVRQRMKSSSRHAITYNFSHEIIDMAEYLGIRILSEPHLLWIVEEAVNAPLPDGWSMYQNKDGKTFFHNVKQNITRWDHPLDPYFRKLRDENRKREFAVEASVEPTTNNPQTQGQKNVESLPTVHQEQSTGSGAIEEDIRDDMSDYYKLRRPPKYTPKSVNAVQPQRHQTTNPQPTPANTTGTFSRLSRPQSAPDDRPQSNDVPNTKLSDTNHMNSLASLPNKNEKIPTVRSTPNNLILSGGTYVDTGTRGNLGLSRIPASRMASTRGSGHSPPKKGPVQAHAMYQSGTVYNINGKKEKNRPSSTSRLRPSNSAASIKGHKPSTNDTYRLHRMYDDNMFEDLDAVMKSSKTTKQQPVNQWRDANSDFATLENITIYNRPTSQYQKTEKIKTKDSDSTVWI